MKWKLLKQIWSMSKYVIYGTFLQVLMVGVLWAGDSKGQKSVYDIYINVSFNNTPLNKVLAEIEQKTGFKFTYNHQVVNEKDRVSLAANNESLGDFLAKLAVEKNLAFKRIDQNIHINKVILSQKANTPPIVELQEIRVSGVVKS